MDVSYDSGSSSMAIHLNDLRQLMQEGSTQGLRMAQTNTAGETCERSPYIPHCQFTQSRCKKGAYGTACSLLQRLQWDLHSHFPGPS